MSNVKLGHNAATAYGVDRTVNGYPGFFEAPVTGSKVRAGYGICSNMLFLYGYSWPSLNVIRVLSLNGLIFAVLHPTIYIHVMLICQLLACRRAIVMSLWNDHIGVSIGHPICYTPHLVCCMNLNAWSDLVSELVQQQDQQIRPWLGKRTHWMIQCN